MNWPAIIVVFVPWLLLGMRILESNLPVRAKLRRQQVERERL